MSEIISATGDVCPEDGTQKQNSLAKALGDVMREGSKKELVFFSDNPDGSANALLVRTCYGSPEAYWFYIDGGIMDKTLAGEIMSANGMSEDTLRTDDGIYRLMANAAGIAACFMTPVPGVKTMQAFVCPVEAALAVFMASHPVTHYETIFVKRAVNTAHKYRKLVDPRPPRQKVQERVVEVEAPEDEEFFDISGEI